MKFSDFTTSEPDGDIVTGPPAIPPSPNDILIGRHVILKPLQLLDSPALFQALGGPENAYLYKYLPGGPFLDLDDFTKHIRFLLSDPIFITYTAFLKDQTEEPAGLVCLMNIVPANRSIEIGHVLFGTGLQRTTAATEVHYLLMKYSFDDLNFLRVEWKANDLNVPSKRAAVRLGFKFEGTFRKHAIVKGKRRDTSWFSTIDDEWNGGIKTALEEWLQESNFDAEGNQRRKLEDFRA